MMRNSGFQRSGYSYFKLVLQAEHGSSLLEFRKGTPELCLHRQRQEVPGPTQVMWEEEVQCPPWQLTKLDRPEPFRP